jgi:hypothetical protein
MIAAAPDLVTAVLRDKAVNTCAAQSGKSAQGYAHAAFDLRHVRLRTGEQMIVATATDPCLALGQSTRIMIFRVGPQRYTRVLSSVTLPGLAHIDPNGTVTLPTHESMEVIFEATYVWNGMNYTFAPLRSHRYDVALAERRPDEIPVRLARGTTTTLSGTVAYNFGNDYVFDAVAGESLTIELKDTGMRPAVALYYENEFSSVVDLDARRSWSGTLRRSGSYHLLVSGADESAARKPSRYHIRLSTR